VETAAVLIGWDGDVSLVCPLSIPGFRFGSLHGGAETSSGVDGKAGTRLLDHPSLSVAAPPCNALMPSGGSPTLSVAWAPSLGGFLMLLPGQGIYLQQCRFG